MNQQPYGQNPFDSTPIFEYPADPPQPRRVNTLATLSLVFAFVFAPAGALLGHLGLAQIRRTGERGHDRALVAVTLSYAFITLSVVGLVAWATLGTNSVNPTAAPPTATTPGKASSTVTTTPAQPTVASNDIPGLVASIEVLKQITGDQNLATNKVWHQIARSDKEGTIDRPECYGALAPGTPEAYDIKDVLGFYAVASTDIHNLRNMVQVIQAVAAFHDAPAAQAQLTKLQTQWRQCSGTSLKVTFAGGLTATMSLSVPADAGNGITTLEQTTQGLPIHTLRAIAAKSNIVTDLVLSYAGNAITSDPQQAIVAIVNYIFARVPG